MGSMGELVIVLVLLSSSLVYCNFEQIFASITLRVSPEVQKKAAQDVLNRLLGPARANLFSLTIVEDENNYEDYFTLLKNDNDEKVSVIGPSGVSLVWGVHYYLKNYCNCHISWDGDRLVLPDVLPSVSIFMKPIEKLRYYQNVCTSSYSFVWWDWNRWEREIDWMALNGINLALAFTGQEAIWQRVYDALGLESNDFTGPAFLAWNRMGNLRNFSHGLSNNWHNGQLALQNKIISRMRDLGIRPVLPTFCGIVPRSFEKSYPEANLTKMSKWGRFSDEYCCPYFLSPSDPLFSVVSRIYLREYISEFGTNHIYNCDMFNENIPQSGDPEYLSNISKSVYKEISSVDPGAVWMIQGWMFIDPFWESSERVKAFVTGVPKGHMLILDLQSDLTPQYERLHSYYGQPFIWCTLHNFGGQLGMYGHLSRVNSEVLKGRNLENSTMVGIGITPEGIDQNYIMYEFTLESTFRSTLVNLSEWVSQYAFRRYGVLNEHVTEAWLILKDTAYNYEPEATRRSSVQGSQPYKLVHGEHISKNILTKLPSIHMNEPSWYNRSKMFDVFQKFLAASVDESISSSELFRHDFIDVTRQTIQFAISGLYFQLLREYALLNVDNFKKISEKFLGILDELDLILKSGKKFLLGSWLESAKSLGKNEMERIHYEFDARNQITLWGPNGEIRDYAAKQWSGLIADYYKPRWEIFIRALNQSLVNDVPYNSSAVKEKIFRSVEKPFGTDRKTYPSTPEGNTLQLIRKFNDQWKDILFEIFENFTSSELEVNMN